MQNDYDDYNNKKKTSDCFSLSGPNSILQQGQINPLEFDSLEGYNLTYIYKHCLIFPSRAVTARCYAHFRVSATPPSACVLTHVNAVMQKL